MTFAEYIKDKAFLLALHLSCMFLLFGFLLATEYPAEFCVLIAVCWALIASALFGGGLLQKAELFFGNVKDFGADGSALSPGGDDA